MSNKNPFNLHTITPYLIIDKVPEQIEFLKKVFDAELRGELKYRKDGSVQHAEVTIGDSVVMMGTPVGAFESMNGGFYLYVGDCDKTYQKALDVGAESIMEPQDFPHGDRYGGVKDFNGNIWWIVTHVGKM